MVRTDDLFTDEDYISFKRRKTEVQIAQAEDQRDHQNQRHALEMELLQHQIEESAARKVLCNNLSSLAQSLKELVDNKIVTSLAETFVTED